MADDIDDIADGLDSDDEENTIQVGMTFDTASHALYAIQDYALSHGRSVRVTNRSGNHRFIGCSSANCPFSVRVYRAQRRDNSVGTWRISSVNLEHENCVSAANPTGRQIAELSTFSSAVAADGTVSATALTAQVQSRDGISLLKKRRTLYRARQQLNDVSCDQLALSYQRIPSYLAQFASLNPGAVAIAEQDDQGRFRRAIVIVKVFAEATKACQSIVGIDCSHSKCPSYSGMQMHLVGRDGNLRNVTLAFGLVESEDAENYTWFFTVLKRTGYVFTETPMFCDRSAAMISVATDMGFDLKFCTLHIIRNLLGRFRNFTHHHKNLIWSLQSSETEALYTSRLSWIGMELGDDVKTYLEGIPPIRWCVFANIGICPLYGWRTSNFVESVFGSQLVKGMRHMHPLAFIQAMCTSFVDECFKRSENAASWLDKGLKLTPAATKLYSKQASRIGQYSVQQASSDVFYVHETSSTVKVRRRVNLSIRSCTCSDFHQMGVPCRHLVAALEHIRKLEDVFTFFEDCYLVSTYAAAFGNKSVHIPIESEVSSDASWLPAVYVKRVGRPKTKRIRSVGEEGSGSMNRCGICHQRGHNKRTCRVT